jgi:hypothetical protein
LIVFPVFSTKLKPFAEKFIFFEFTAETPHLFGHPPVGGQVPRLQGFTEFALKPPNRSQGGRKTPP